MSLRLAPYPASALGHLKAIIDKPISEGADLETTGGYQLESALLRKTAPRQHITSSRLNRILVASKRPTKRRRAEECRLTAGIVRLGRDPG